MISRLHVTLTLLASLAFTTVAATDTQAEVKKVTSIEGITEYKLSNGLSVLLFPDESKPTVTVNLTVFVGSRHEGYGEAGMAHLLEHMLFKGTPTHTDIPKLLKDRGARFNGTTWLDRTNYYETMPASPSNLEFALKLESDRMINSNVDEKDLKSEFSVVRSEFERGENSPTRVLWQRMVSAAYLWHNYGNSTIGNQADIENVPIQNLKRFYKRFYQPDNAMLVIAGKFKEEDALKLTEKYFGAIPKATRKLDATYTQEPAQDGERHVTLRRAGDVAAVGLVYHIPAGSHPDYPAIDVLQGILTSQPAGRLYKAAVETKRAANVMGAGFALHDPGFLLFLAEVNKGNEPQIVLETLIDTIEAVGESEISKDDVERAKQQLLKQRELSASNTSAIAIDLSEWAAQGDWRLYFLYRDRLEKVDAKQVRKVAKAYFKQNNRTVGMYLPTKKTERVSVPASPNLAKMIGNYKGRKSVAQGEAFDVSPDNVESRTRRLTINGDIRVSLLNKKTRGETVTIRMTLRYGDEKSLTNKSAAADYLGSLMTRGTAKLSRQQLQDQMDKLVAQLSGSGGSGSVSFRIQTKKANLPTVLGLLKQVLREPALSDSELQLMKNATIAGIEKQLTDPTALAQNAALRHLSSAPKGHPLHVATIPEELALVKAVTIGNVKELYNDYLGAQHGEISVVGDFDADETLAQLQDMLAKWKSQKTYARIERSGKAPEKGMAKDINTPDKANATYFAATKFELRDDNGDYPALLLGNYILGGGALSNRLGERVRQKDGLSYGVGSGLSVSALDNRSMLYVYAISNPKNTAKVKAAIKEEIAKLLKDGVTEEELSAAKKGYLQSQAVGRSSDGALSGLLNETAHANRSMQHYTGLETKIGSVTSEQVLSVIRKYIDINRFAIVTAGDFEKIESKEDSKEEK
jgi:zinc protease